MNQQVKKSSAETTENIQPQDKSEEEMKSKDKTSKSSCLLPVFKSILQVTSSTHLAFLPNLITSLLPAVIVLFAVLPIWGSPNLCPLTLCWCHGMLA